MIFSEWSQLEWIRKLDLQLSQLSFSAASPSTSQLMMMQIVNGASRYLFRTNTFAFFHSACSSRRQ